MERAKRAGVSIEAYLAAKPDPTRIRGNGLSGENHPAWKGGRHLQGGGYVRVLAPGHPNADRRGYVLEHRLVMSAHLGRPLLRAEHVHHIDHDRANNDWANLRLMTASDHLRMHGGEYPHQAVCSAGHPMEGDNLYVQPSGRRACRACIQRRCREYRLRHRDPATPPAMKDRTHCPQGHPYDEKNTYWRPGGGRACKECCRARTKAARAAAS